MPDGTFMLDARVLRFLASVRGWTELRPVQQISVGPIVVGDNVIITASTAGGKTEAVMLPLVSRLLQKRPPPPSVLYFAPLRSLVEDLVDRLTPMVERLGLRLGAWHGATPESERARVVEDPPDILFVTPEALTAMLLTGRWRDVALENVEAVVVDEVHAFAGDPRGAQLRWLVGLLDELRPRDVQRLALSATVPNAAEVLQWLSGRSARPQTVVAAPARAVEKLVETARCLTDDDLQNAVIAATGHQRALVFAPTRRRAEELALALNAAGLRSQAHHAGLARSLRREVEDNFRAGTTQALVCTSTMELGVDIGDVSLVVQVGAPPSVAALVQRMGRSGRRGGPQRLLVCDTTPANNPRAKSALAELVRRAIALDIEPVVPPAPDERVATQECMVRLIVGLPVDPTTRGRLTTEGWIKPAGDGRYYPTDKAEQEWGHNCMDLALSGDADPEVDVFDSSGETIGSVRRREWAPGERVLLGGRWLTMRDGG